ncbi:thiamine pyrophosphate-dependent enzyme [Salipaludibacillus sp. LMS25]|jgi:phosphonopyruvate decarboxylase|uniref:thiamine pyrophosphate-dependent enzyme n=1 Tax=Salipaludibacillus sp. LMS25 TaxID=2924031 RepID=UPI0020D18313|nr:thiamine pyrophosphate-dependent enzyme [Salipaludibacillus sp. LMS25]UTR15955.1 thiamine pyrophosphate-dependent enzyme [Salipaludibacillus sp. LMS25]
MKKTEAILNLVNKNPESYIVSTCGYISRDLYNLKDSDHNFYMVGSMGMAAPIGLGLAIDNPNIEVIVLDGDGSLLMNMGFMSMVGELKPSNFTHVVLDNHMHESTGGQKTIKITRICEVSENLGYEKGKVVKDFNEIPVVKEVRGPILIHIEVDPKDNTVGERVHWTPQEIVKRFQKSIFQERELIK